MLVLFREGWCRAAIGSLLSLVFLSATTMQATAQESAEDAYKKLVEEYDQAKKQFDEKLEAAEDAAEKRKIRADDPRRDFAEKFMEFAEKNPKSEFALKAVRWDFANSRYAGSEIIKRGAKLAYENHLADLQMSDFGNIVRFSGVDREELFKKSLNVVKDKDLKGAIGYSMVSLVTSQVRGELSKEEEKEVIAKLEKLKKEIGSIEFRGTSLSEEVDSTIFQLKNLKIGKTAPEILGEDLDGVDFKLTDYRGKVVVLDFWGDW